MSSNITTLTANMDSKETNPVPASQIEDLKSATVSLSKQEHMFYGETLSDEALVEARKFERRVKRKLDFIILPLLASVYFIAQMGRSDLGNAYIAGMDEDLNITPHQYSNLASLFLVGYLIFQLPGTLLVRKIGPPLQFCAAMLAWGGITISTVAAQSYGSVLAIRMLIGVAEAFVQGAVFYLSFWYTQNELATRGAIFYSTAALAGSFNGLVAYAIQVTLDGKNGWEAWRWIFFIEGVLPMGWAFVILVLLPRTPETAKAWYFTTEEKELIVKRSRAAHNTGESKIRPKLILRTLIDPMFWGYCLIDMGTHFCVSSLSNFIPDILRGFGWSSVRAQLMSVIIYACAVVGIIGSAKLADKRLGRGLVICINACLAVLAYALLLGLTGSTGRFIASCLAAATTYPNIVLVLSWAANNNPGYTFRGSMAALINVISQCLAISGNQAYNDPPLYRTGNASALAMMALSGVSSAVMLFALRRQNKIKDEFRNTEEAARIRMEKTVDDIGHRHPDVKYYY